jgi:hypothetical protein
MPCDRPEADTDDDASSPVAPIASITDRYALDQQGSSQPQLTECRFLLQEGRIEADYTTTAEGAAATRVFTDSKVAPKYTTPLAVSLLQCSDACKPASLWHAGSRSARQEDRPDGGR